MTNQRTKLALLIFALALIACALTLHYRSRRAMDRLEAHWVDHLRQVDASQRK
jgi:hypothetical protein